MSNPLQNKSKVSTLSRRKWTVVYPINTGLLSETCQILIGQSGHFCAHMCRQSREKCPGVHQNPGTTQVKPKKQKARTNAGQSAYKNNNVPINTYIYIVDRKTFIYIRPVGRGFALVHASVHVDEKLGRTGQKKKCCFYPTLYTTIITNPTIQV